MEIPVKFWQKDNFLLGIIIVIGVVLRFYNAFEIPFTHDELSSYYRLQFNSFSELIEGGVKPDGHPALIQVFMFYWTRLFGTSEIIFKLPFLIMGIATIPLSYIITKKWFNSTSALWVASFMASLQFPVMFSQIARPYISGLFFSLFLVFYWSSFLFEEKPKKWKAALGIVIFASLCSYNHYFSLMFAGIIGITGLFFLTKANWKTYLIAILSTVVLFLPHLSIFFHQLSLKGLDWLGKPGIQFYLEFIKFIFHFSYIAYLVPIFGLIYGIYQSKSARLNKFQIISLAWFFLPITIGLIYSIFIKPVIQYSMLIFSFPFLLVFLFSFLKKNTLKFKIASVSIILLTNISTLILNRAHYSVFYTQPFERTAKIISQFNAGYFTKSAPENVQIIVNDNPKFFGYYLKKYKVITPFKSISEIEISPQKFHNLIQNQSPNYLFLANIPRYLVDMAKDEYPYLIYQEWSVNNFIWILSKEKYSKRNFNVEAPLLSKQILNTKASHSVIQLDSTQEWGPVLELGLDSTINSRHSEVHLQLDFKTNHTKNGMIVISVTDKNDSTLLWRASNLDDFQSVETNSTWKRAYLAVSLTSTFYNPSTIKGSKLKVLYWNTDKGNITLQNFNLTITDGNPFEYATIEKID